MLRQPHRPHREILWRQLKKRPEIFDHGLISVKKKRDGAWLGQQNLQNQWHDHHASMDLYQDCYLEIVPETCYRDLWFLTEKTRKPMITKTPFLMVSNAGYLAWLRDQGFRTFDSLISEKYDQCWRIQDRVTLMLDQLQNIIANGTKDFYTACQPILEHNFYRFCELSGSWYYHYDQVLWRLLTNSSHDCNKGDAVSVL